MTDRHLPRYRAIEKALRARVATLEPGDPLPSDAALCTEFGVSRMTARGAMQRLVEDGLVHREPGRGSYVAVPPAHRRANSLMSFSEEMRRRGRRPTSRLLRREIRPPTAAEVRDLDLREDEPVVELLRVRLADDRPVAVESAVLSGTCAPAVMQADLEAGSLHELLAATGCVPTRGRATISAEAASAEDARHLGVPTGSPLLVERRVIDDPLGRPLEMTVSRYPADRYALDVDFEVEASRGRGGRREPS